MTLYYQNQSDSIIITGDTFRYKEHIKQLGGRFVAQTKSWVVPHNSETITKIEHLCRLAKGGAASDDITTATAPKRFVPQIDQVISHNMSFAAMSPAAGTTEQDNTQNSVTIAELLQGVQTCIQAKFSRPLWVIGEIQNINLRARGTFLTLAEPKQSANIAATMAISATIWSQTLQMLKDKYDKSTLETIFQDGMKVRVLCSISLYKDRGALTLNIHDIDSSFTKGALALQREQLVKELKKQELYDKNKKTRLGSFPLQVGLISAEGSRAKADFLDQLLVYQFPGEVIFYPAQMQGDALLTEVVAGIRALTHLKCDVIVITRGGGSAADLRWFDSPEIAYAIAQCPLPVISAIGHHDDLSIAEEISFHKEKTPTAAADYIVAIIQRTHSRLDDIRNYFSQKMQDKIDLAEQTHFALLSRLQAATKDKLMRAATLVHRQQTLLTDTYHRGLMSANSRFAGLSSALLREATAALNRGDQRIVNLITGINLSTKSRYQTTLITISAMVSALDKSARAPLARLENNLSKQHGLLLLKSTMKFEEAWQKITALQHACKLVDPSPWMSQGWTRLLGVRGTIKSIRDATLNEQVSARFVDGSMTLTVEKIDIISEPTAPKE